MKSKWPAYLSMFGGAWLLLLCIPHFFIGFPSISEGLKAENVSHHLSRALRIIWIFSSITMTQLALLALLVGFRELKDGRSRSQFQLIIGGGLTLFVGIAFLFSFPNWFMLVFLPSGGMLLAAGMMRRAQ